jgi:predicted nuclease of restriction endonuclease-like (RecB) superfamily
MLMANDITTKKLSLQINKDYKDFLQEIKRRIKSSRLRAALTVNQEVIKFYWEIGQLIIEKQNASSWGDKLIEALASDLKKGFPDTQGFSRSNLHSMRKFAQVYPSFEIVQALPGQLPWTHNLVMLEQVKSTEQRLWYAQQTLEHGWSYRALIAQIKEKLYETKGNNKIKTTNFHLKLPSPQSSLAEETIKDPYKFHFLTVGEDAHEKEIHQGLLNHVKQFLMALGQGFALYGTHHPLQISNKRYELDLLMYHTKLHCYVVIEIKRGEFHPRDTGQLNFYLSAVDDVLKTPQDNPTIGLLLCEKKDRVIAEYALRDVNKPMGISEFELFKALPKKLKTNLPTIAEIEAELNTEFVKQTAPKIPLKKKIKSLKKRK